MDEVTEVETIRASVTNETSPNKLATSVLAGLCLVCLTSGVGAVMAQKWQARFRYRRCSDLLDSRCDASNFQAPFWQTMVMFAAETVCLVPWLVDRLLPRKKDRKPTSARKLFKMLKPSSSCTCRATNPPGSWVIWVLPACLDLCGATLCNIALTLTFASTVQMMRAFCVIATAGISLFIIKKPLLIHQWLGVMGITIGMFVAGIGALVSPEMSSSQAAGLSYRALVGILLALCGTAVQSLQLVVEEAILTRYSFDPLQAIGLEGAHGLVLGSMALMVAHFVQYESGQVTVYQMRSLPGLMLANVVYMYNCFVFNASGMFVTTLGGSVLKGVIFSMRAPVLWVAELCVGWRAFDLSNFFGLLIVVPSFLIYSYTFQKLRSKRTNFLSQPVNTCCTLPIECFESEQRGVKCVCDGIVDLPDKSSCYEAKPCPMPPPQEQSSVEISGMRCSSCRSYTPPALPVECSTPPPARRAITPTRGATRCLLCHAEREQASHKNCTSKTCAIP